MLRSKPVRASRGERDGLRASVMNRHTLNDGKTPDPTISEDMYDVWWPQFAAPPRLLGDYYKRGMSWDEFETRYADYLETAEASESVMLLANAALHRNVTVLCTEEAPDHCHRRLLVAHCQLLVPELEVDIR